MEKLEVFAKSLGSKKVLFSSFYY